MKYWSLWNDALPFGSWRDGMLDSYETPAFRPVVDVEETETHFMVSLDVPGVSKKDITIELRDNELLISGERKSHGKFQRVLTLPTGIETDKIEAEHRDGVLTVALPKSESAKPRRIKISEGEGSFFGKFLGKAQEPKREIETKEVSKTAATHAA